MTEDEAKGWISDRVSRETMERLGTYNALLTRWQKTINLVAPSTVDQAWARHFADSAQLFDLAPRMSRTWLDLGSGGGFPGLVVAAMAREFRPELTMTLVESDIRKCGFLREAARKMDIDVNILPSRIGDIPRQVADVVSARALSNLEKLLHYAKPHTSPKTCFLLPKGLTYAEELETVPNDWQIKAEVIESVTDSDAVVLRFRSPVFDGED